MRLWLYVCVCELVSVSGLVSLDTVWILWHGGRAHMEEGYVSWGIVILNKATF